MLDLICHLRPFHSYWEGPKEISFTNILKCVRGASSPLESSESTLPCRPDGTVGTVVPQLEKLNAMGVNWI